MVKIVVTGGLGFIGHHFVEHIIRKTNWIVYIIDKLSYASRGFQRLKSSNLFSCNRLVIFTYDLNLPISEGIKLEIGEDVDYIVHMAAETHVDNSIADPVNFINNNIQSTLSILEYSKELPLLKKFFYFSTDEVYGSALNGVSYKENDAMNPTNPYSASKASGEHICTSYINTYKLPIVIINCMNAMGERQHVEKFIPKCVQMILNGETILIHADETCTVPGSRSYIHARNISDAVMFLINKGEIGERYNITGEREINNLDLALLIGKLMGKEIKYELVNFHEQRVGHDLVYRLNGEKLEKLGWKAPVSFEESLRHTIEWTLNNKDWLNWQTYN